MKVCELAEIVSSFKTEVLGALKGLEDKIQSIFHTNREIETRLKYIEDKLCDLENQSRRENLLFFGVTENPGESWQDAENKLCQIIKDKLGIDKEITFQRVHRLGKSRNGVF